VTPPAALAIDLDGVLGDTRRLWDDWLAETSRVLGVDPTTLPTDRGVAATLLDGGGAGNWRALLERFAEDRAPVYLRPAAEASSALRRLAAAGTRVGVFTDAPAELAHIALAQLGATRRVDAVEAGTGALERLREILGPETVTVLTRAELGAAAPS
jgi:phosphoglycolate phosphatase-like HAD superfamily hydrolase